MKWTFSSKQGTIVDNDSDLTKGLSMYLSRSLVENIVPAFKER